MWSYAAAGTVTSFAVDGVERFSVERVLAIGEADQEGQVAEPVDPPRDAARQLVSRLQGVGSEDFAGGASGLEPVSNVVSRFSDRKHRQRQLDVNALVESAMTLHHWTERRLAD